MRGSRRALRPHHRRPLRHRPRHRSGCSLAQGYDLTLAAGSSSGSRLRAAELGAHACAADVSVEEDCLSLVAAHVERHGGLDVLVNSAGVGLRGPYRSTPRRRGSTSSIAVNLQGRFSHMRGAAPPSADEGLVANPASIAGTIPTPGLASYGAAKAAVISLTRSIGARGGVDRSPCDRALPRPLWTRR